MPAGLSLGALGLGGVFSGLGEKAEDVKEAVTEKIEDIKNVFTGNDEAPEVTRSGNTYILLLLLEITVVVALYGSGYYH